MITTATAIAAVQTQPRAQSGHGRVNRPITLGCIAMIMMTPMSGTATIPFSTRRPEQRLDRIETDEIDEDPHQRRDGDRRIEGFCVQRSPRQSRRPAQCLAQCVGRRACQHRHREQADPDDADREDRKSEQPGQRAQRLGSLRRCLDIRHSGGVQCCRSGDDDEQADQIGIAHPEIGIEANPPDLAWRLLGRIEKRFGVWVDLLVLGFLRGLPEEAVRRDRGAEHGDNRHDIIRAERETRQKRIMDNLSPRDPHHERSRHVGEQRQRRPFHEMDIAFVTRERLQQGAADREAHHVQVRWPADQKLHRRAHCAEIGAEIERVGDQQKGNDAPQQPGRVMGADIGRDPVAGDPADAGADLLDCRHQRPGEQHHPAHRRAELRASLRVGGDAARVVVRCAGDQPWPQLRQPASRCRADRCTMQGDTSGQRKRLALPPCANSDSCAHVAIG